MSNAHLWIWVNEPQQGSAVQAVASGLEAAFALNAVVFTWLAFRAAKRQAVAAEAQTAVAMEQLERERTAYAEEQRVLASEQSERLKLALIREDVERPRFDVRLVTAFNRVVLSNAGLTSAIGLLAIDIMDESTKLYEPVCNPGQQCGECWSGLQSVC